MQALSPRNSSLRNLFKENCHGGLRRFSYKDVNHSTAYNWKKKKQNPKLQTTFFFFFTIGYCPEKATMCSGNRMWWSFWIWCRRHWNIWESVYYLMLKRGKDRKTAQTPRRPLSRLRLFQHVCTCAKGWGEPHNTGTVDICGQWD